MECTDWIEDGVCVGVGLLLALVVGAASHWCAGLALLMVWMVLQALTWGFASVLRPGQRSAQPALESRQ